MESQLKIRLKAARKTAGYRTVKNFCEENGLDRSAYSQHEKGTRHPTDATLRKYCEVLGINFEWLKFGDGPPYTDATHSGKENDLNHELQLINQALEKSFNEYFENRPLHYNLNKPLLTAILEEILTLYVQSEKNLSIKKVSSLIIGIYTDITSTESNHDIQVKMVKPTVAAYKRMMEP